ncbi:MAG: MFS transporter [Bifidobacterium tibiigranuli]|jgi:multidrug resistance protein|uniref:MFS transporter n=1 Tax=Bifidobacterium tibiigranuli TaxID=2172043 RepID=UPI0026EC3CF9|nr:MFS transporter [Bifidobacterium tibiigranuli]MCI1674038.1 MFS transporter [Bifidobacterium tibiigranuli]MCI1713990.1 MFS transporter [Bifidobacterium tibiigranuli]
MRLSQKMTVASFFIAVFIVGLDSFIISALLPTISAAFGTSVSAVGLGVTLYAVFYAVGAPIIAPFSERLPRKRMIMIGLAVFTLATFLCGLAKNIAFFYVARSLAGLGAAMFTPNVFAYIGGNFSKENIGKVMGIVMSALSLSIAIGVPIGSFIAGALNWNWTFFCSSIFAAVSFILILAFAQRDSVPDVEKRDSPFSHYRNVFTTPKAVLGLLAELLWMYGFYAVYTFVGTYAGSTFHLSVEAIGLVFVAYGVSNFVTTFSSGLISNAWGMKRAVLVAGLASVVTYILLGLHNLTLVAFVVVLAVMAFAQGIGVPQFTTFNATVLPESRTTMTSLNSSFLYLGLTIGSALGGLLFQHISFLAVGISALISTLLAVLVTRKIM